MKVARHEMPGMCHPEARPVGYGMIGWREAAIGLGWWTGWRRRSHHSFLRRHHGYGGQEETDHVCPLPGISCLATIISPSAPKAKAVAPTRALANRRRRRTTGEGSVRNLFEI